MTIFFAEYNNNNNNNQIKHMYDEEYKRLEVI